MSYAELFCQSHFSFLTGAASPEQLVTEAASLGYQAIAITDECSVAGVVRAHRQIQEQQLPLKLIIGSLFRIEDLTVVLLCPSRQAYAELCRIISNSRRRAEKGDYQLELWDLKSCRHCLLLWLPSRTAERDSHWSLWLQRYFTKRCYIAAHRGLDSQDGSFISYHHWLRQQSGFPLTAVGAVLMATPEQKPLLDVVTAIRLGTTVAGAGTSISANAERCLRTLRKLQQLYSSDWLVTSLEIASLCQFSLASLRYEYPSELVPAGQTPMHHLTELVMAGAQVRFGETIPTAVADTLARELKLIDELDYAYYFLTINDIVRFARDRQILHQGRGSAANSVVCYCLQITAVDPRQFSLLFERFISKERAEPPDIDVDFEHERREEVIQYIYQKYGRQRAALAATVICYRFRSSLRDVGKALGYPISQLEYLQKQINRRHPTLKWQQQLADLGLDPDAQQTKLLISLVEQIRGTPRHLSQHVGGFVISAGPLYELVPVENAAMTERTVIQWDKDDIETLGLLKVDILALGMLTAIRKTLSLINHQEGNSLSLAKISALPDDPQVYLRIQQADTVGVFQIESRAQMSMLPRLKPRCFYDLVIEIAIVRPGPIQGDMVHPYLRRRDGKEAVDYPSAAVAEVLSRTLGVPIFQEQVIKLAMVAAGFSGGEADQLRRAMASWKKNGQLEQFRPKLINGMLARGYSIEFAERLFDQMCGFGEYGFPESHSASFALLAYASAWLKHYYPLEFYCSLLNSLPMGFYSASQLIQDAKRHQIMVLPVCINSSGWSYQIQQHGEIRALRIGFCQVKGLQCQRIEKMLSLRPQQGFSHVGQLKAAGLNAGDIAALASSDSLQAIAGHRFAARWLLLDKVHELPLFADLKAPATETTSLGVQTETQTSSCVQNTELTARKRQTFEVNAKAWRQNSPTAGLLLLQQLFQKDEEALEPSFEHHNEQSTAVAMATPMLISTPSAPSEMNTQDLDCPLTPPTAVQTLLEDWHSLRLSLSQHPMAILRTHKALRGVCLAKDLRHYAVNQPIAVAGLVTVRQSPGTAAGVTFVTLEDETGLVNLIVWQATSLAQQVPFLTAKLLKVHGILQREGQVIHVIAAQLHTLDPLLPELTSTSRDFH